MSQYNFPGASTVVTLLAASSNAATVNGTGVDLLAYEGPLLIVQNHGTSTGTLDGKIQDSADNSTFADVAGATFTQETTGASIQKIVLNKSAVRRYIRYVGTIVTGPQLFGVSFSGLKQIV